MRFNYFRAVALTAFSVLFLSVVSAPTASAQQDDQGREYITAPAPQAVCTELPGFELTLQGATIIVVIPEIYLQCVTRLEVDVDGAIYDGAAPASLILRLPLAPLADGEYTVTATATTLLGDTKVETLLLSSSDVNAINALLGASPDGAQRNPVVDLATTGSTVRTPVVIAALLVGSGGMAMFFARKREQQLAIR